MQFNINVPELHEQSRLKEQWGYIKSKNTILIQKPKVATITRPRMQSGHKIREKIIKNKTRLFSIGFVYPVDYCYNCSLKPNKI